MRIVTSIILSSLVLFIFCQCSSSEKKSNVNIKAVQSDTIHRDIPVTKRTASYRKVKKTVEDFIGLESLENGFNTEEFRIWFANSSSREQLIVLKNISGKWAAEFYLLTYNYDTATNKLQSINKEVERKKPISSWQSFIDNLFLLGVTKLPDMSKLDNYQIGFDGKTITVEFANKNTYRIYSYWEPKANQDKVPEAKKIELISELLERELSFKRL
ncbi:MAG: hypothetical protein K2X37_11035 [Chitinophagaceae bacterium]|nr:hypothetical protein [Chitinophagaceae bacterium]